MRLIIMRGDSIDSLSCFESDFEVVKEKILKLNPKAEIFELSAKTGPGVAAWVEWLPSVVSCR